MIEVIYKEEKQEAKNGENLFNLPRNIRQVGLTTGNMRIYIEDYVYTFLTRLARNAVGSRKEQGCVAVFTGETKWNNGITYLFIRGALMVEDMEAASDHIDFSEKIWAKIQEDQAKYFPGQEITGWFFSRPQMYMETDELLTRIHLRYFGGEKVLMLMEPAEKEEAFFFFENGLMVRQRGYYIYYEKNPLMQEYMIEKNKDFAPEFTENVSDEAVVSFRKIIRNKKTKKAEKTEEKPQEEMERTSVFSYAATACLVLAVLAVGAGFYRNYGGLPVQPEDDYAVTVMSEKTEADASEGEKQAENDTNQSLDVSKQEKSTQEQLEKNASVTPKITQEAADTEISDETWNSWQDSESDFANEAEAAEQTKAEEPAETVDQTETFSQEADERKIKKQSTNAEEQTDSSAQTSSDGIYETYVIKPGDTLYQISISHYGNMDAIPEICRLNNLEENQVIYPGQMIVLP